MILTVNEIHNMIPVLNKLVKEPLPIQTAFRLTRICKVLDREMEMISDKQLEVLEKYCERNDDGEPLEGPKGEFVFKEEGSKKANEETFELGRTELDLSLDKFDINSFGDIQLTAQDLMFIFPLLNEEG